jgi:hypothetical protein
MLILLGYAAVIGMGLNNIDVPKMGIQLGVGKQGFRCIAKIKNTVA